MIILPRANCVSAPSPREELRTEVVVASVDADSYAEDGLRSLRNGPDCRGRREWYWRWAERER